MYQVNVFTSINSVYQVNVFTSINSVYQVNVFTSINSVYQVNISSTYNALYYNPYEPSAVHLPYFIPVIALIVITTQARFQGSEPILHHATDMFISLLLCYSAELHEY